MYDERQVRSAVAHLKSALAKARAELKAQEFGSGRDSAGLYALERELRLDVQLADEALGVRDREDADPDVWPFLMERRWDDHPAEEVLAEGERRWAAQDLEVQMRVAPPRPDEEEA